MRPSACMTYWNCSWDGRKEENCKNLGYMFPGQKMAFNSVLSPMALWLCTASLGKRGQSPVRCLSKLIDNHFPNAPLLKEKVSGTLNVRLKGRMPRARSQRAGSILWAQDNFPSVQYEVTVIFALLVCELWKSMAREGTSILRHSMEC